MQHTSSAISFSPSFNSYSSGNLAEIAARVVGEFRSDSVSSDYDDDVYNFNQDEYVENTNNNEAQIKPHGEMKESEEVGEEDDEFEFAVICREADSSPISADEIFYNGQIKPVFPIFNTDLLLDQGIDVSSAINSKPPARLSLRKLFMEERDSPSSSFSSTADKLEGALPETYCVWRPKSPGNSPELSKKSNSTGNYSKRWKFKDLLYRSHSDGKDTFVILSPLSGSKTERVVKSRSVKITGAGEEGVLTATEAQKPTKKKITNRKESEKRRSYLPYKPDLFGIFASVNGLSRNIHPF